MTITFSGGVPGVSADTEPATAVGGATGMSGRLPGMGWGGLEESNGARDIRSFWGGLSGVAAGDDGAGALSGCEFSFSRGSC